MPLDLWYPLVALVCHFAFCCEAHNEESTINQHELNNDDHAVGKGAINLTSKNDTLHSPRKCGLLFKEKCVHKLKSKNKNVKKSFRPYDYYDNEDDYDEDDHSPDADEEFPEEGEAGSYRSYDDLMSRPRDHERLYDDDSEPEDEEFEPRHDRPGYEDGADDDIDADRDWDSPRGHYRRHSRGRWRSHHTPNYHDEYEPNYSHQHRHHPRHPRYHHYLHYRAPVHASYSTFSHAAPSWLTYSQGYPRGTSVTTPVLSPFISNPIGTGWIRGPASYNIGRQPLYYPLQAAPRNLINAQLTGSSNLNPYQQNIYSYPQRESNSFFIPPYPVSSSPYIQATSRNHAGFSTPFFLPGIAGTLPRLSHHIYHYPRVISRSRHFISPFSRSFPRHREFSDAVLNRIRDLNLH